MQAGWNRELRIHDLRHFATTVLFMDEIPDAMIAKMTGHRSGQLRKYQHLRPEFKQLTVEKIAQKLTGTSGTVSVSELIQ
jgi:integrase